MAKTVNVDEEALKLELLALPERIKRVGRLFTLPSLENYKGAQAINWVDTEGEQQSLKACKLDWGEFESYRKVRGIWAWRSHLDVDLELKERTESTRLLWGITRDGVVLVIHLEYFYNNRTVIDKGVEVASTKDDTCFYSGIRVKPVHILDLPALSRELEKDTEPECLTYEWMLSSFYFAYDKLVRPARNRMQKINRSHESLGKAVRALCPITGASA